MFSELFGLLSSVDVSNKGSNRKFSINLNKNRIRSISAFSSNSIFYFPDIVSDQCMPEEIAMTTRMIEKSYASFVVACISLMPFHRIKADDQASIEEYLAQFHQNIGMNPGTTGATANRLFGFVDAITESADESEGVKALQDYLYECWQTSLRENTDFIKVVSSEISLNDMFNESALDPKTQALQERYFKIQEELDTWGFLGEATENLFDVEDDELDLSDEELLARMDADDEKAFEQYLDGDEDDDVDPEDMFPEIDSMLDESASFDKLYAKHEKRLNDPRFNLFGSSGAFEDLHISVQIEKLIKAATTEEELKKAEAIISRYSFGSIDSAMKKSVDNAIDRQRKKISKSVNESAVKTAIDNIRFSLETVSSNKIMSCSSLTKLNKLESKLNKLKNKYTKYLNRYKRKYEENKKSGSKSKLSIRFNNMSIENPKAFMKQYGKYIKLINKRLKLVEKRRAELRKRKGLAESVDQITEMELNALDYCDQIITESLNAPDSQIFILTEANAPKSKDDQLKELGQRKRELEQDIANYKTRNERIGKIAMNSKKRQIELDRENKRLQGELNKVANRNGRPMTRAELAQIEREKEDSKLDNDDLRVEYDPARSRHGINPYLAVDARQTSYKTFDKEVFTDMDMKKANEAVPIFAHASIGFVIDETEEVVTRDVLVGIKAYVHSAPSLELINDIYNGIINKRKFLRFVKFITGEERSLSDLIFGIKELRTDALDAKTGAGQWRSAFKRRRRWAKMSIPYLTKEYTPNGTITMTMNEVQFIKDQYGIDIMKPDHVRMIMDNAFLLGFVIIDQANEMIYITYDGHGGTFQQYTYAMAERNNNDGINQREMRELYRAMSR